MTTPDLLAEMGRRGVKVALLEGALQFDAPRGSMRDLLPLVARLKPELIEALAEAQEAPRIEPPTPYPFAPVEVLRAAHARGVAVSSYGWPLCYWPGDYVEELKAWKLREATAEKKPNL
jgi:hypothetical protein